MTTLSPTTVQAEEHVDAWLRSFAEAVERRDAAGAAAGFTADGFWRDLLAFTWDITTHQSPEQIRSALARAFGSVDATKFRRDEDREPTLVERNGIPCIEAFFRFRTDTARCRGVLRLRADGDGDQLEAWTLLTTVDELIGHEERTGHRRPRGAGYAFGGENWLDRRLRTHAFEDEDPEVLIVGAGQAGLTLAARLGMLGVPALIIERNERIGDNWRNRYHSLSLHNEIWACQLPYLPFPASWPAFVPKDMLAGWFEFYAFAMELNIWTSAEPLDGSWDAEAGCWTVEVQKADGSRRTLRPRHFVLATGMSGLPNVPALEGEDDFHGPVVPAGWYQVDDDVEGTRAIVVGAGNSGHDIAQELHSHGAKVTIVQRSSVCVVSVEPSAAAVFAPYHDGGPPTEEVDLVGTSIPYPMLVELQKSATEQFVEWDRELLESLERVGFLLDNGADGSGFYPKYLRTGGGYYLDVGCSQLIASGQIGLKSGVGIERLTSDSVIFADGEEMPADLVVLATGYKNMQEVVRGLLGDEVAERAGRAWGFDEQGELRNMYKRTGQDGFWYMGGSFAQCRIYSKYLALQIKAEREGLLPAQQSGTDAQSRRVIPNNSRVRSSNSAASPSQNGASK